MAVSFVSINDVAFDKLMYVGPQGVYPPNTLEQVPPPLPLLPPVPLLPPLPSLPLPLEVGPLIAARGSGGAL